MSSIPTRDVFTPRQLTFIAEHFPEPSCLTPVNIYTPSAILHGILPDAAKSAKPTLLADKGFDSLRFRPLIPTRVRGSGA